MAPELVAAINGGHSTASDMYAFGVTVAVIYDSSTLKGENWTCPEEAILALLIASCLQTVPSKRPSAAEVHKWTAPLAPAPPAPLAPAPLAPHSGFYWILFLLTCLSSLYAFIWCPLKRVLFCPWGLMNIIAAIFLTFFILALKYGPKNKPPPSLFALAIELGLAYFFGRIMSKSCI
jgi:hypothetical protein